MAQTVIGFFEDASDAQKAIKRLESMGISRQDIDISRGEPSANNKTVSSNRDMQSNHHTRNGVTDFFNSLFGVNSNEADRYSKVGNSGCSIVTVHVQSREQAERAADLLDECGAVDVDEKASQIGYTNTQSDDNNIGRQNRANGQDEAQSIPRIQENLEIGKRTIEQGGVRVRSRIVERPVEEHIRLREERVHVERQPVDRPVSATELNSFREGDIELTERAEVPVVNKQARVIEEIRVSKDVTERDEVVRDTVRNTEVDIDNVNRNENRQDRNDTNLTGLRNL